MYKINKMKGIIVGTKLVEKKPEKQKNVGYRSTSRQVSLGFKYREQQKFENWHYRLILPLGCAIIFKLSVHECF